jgi:Glyoxalase-like domain
VRIDHVVVASSDLQRSGETVGRALDREVVAGGRHEGLGTENLIVPLGSAFIEILAIADPEEAARSELGRLVSARIEAVGEGPMAWAVAVDDVEAVAARLGLRRSAVGRDGAVGALAGLPEALAEPTLPFFIERHGDARGDGIDAIEVSGDAVRLGEWLGAASLPVSVAAGAPGVLAVTVGGHTLT